MYDLTGRCALVTGGNGGIGLGIARGLARAGARIGILGRDTEKNAVAQAQLEALGADAFAIAADATTEEGASQAIAAMTDRFGGLNILVNNAGSLDFSPTATTTLPAWRQQIDANLTCAFLCARAAYPHLVAGGGGKVINVASLASIRGVGAAAAYCAAKGGVVQFTQSLAVEWGPDNVQVNAILPGFTETALTAPAPAEVREASARRTPARRWGSPEDFAGVAVLLAGSASDFITGVAIPVDGGYSVQLA